MTEGLIDEEQGGFRSGKVLVDQIFISALELEKRWYM